MKFVSCLLFIFSISAYAETLKIVPEKLCAMPDDCILEGEKVDFALYADSDFVEGIYSKKIEVTPGFCKKAEVLSQYGLEVSVVDVGAPLRIHVAKVGRFINVLSTKNIYVADSRQLRLVDCSDKDVSCVNVSELKKENQIVEIQTRYALVRLNLSLR